MARWKYTIILTVAAYILLSILDKHLKCNMSSIISSVCLAYESGQVSGPLCSDLCNEKTIHFHKCLSTVTEKTVYDGEWRSKQVILKMSRDWYKLFEEVHDYIKYDGHLSFYKRFVSSRVETLFSNCSQCEELTSHLMQLCDDNNDGKVTETEVRSFATLLQLLEPMMLIALNESKHSVDFYGYCGGLYVVEKLPFVASQVFGETWEFRDLSLLPDLFDPLEEVGRNMAEKIVNAVFAIPYVGHILSDPLKLTKYYIFSIIAQTHVPSEQEKFRFVYSIIDATLGVSSNPYGMLQSCDLHLGNYGFTNHSVVKVIDFDHTYPVAYLGKRFMQKQCTSDDDCWVGHINDCQSSCDKASGTCKSVARKQDLINICRVHLPFIFRGPFNLKTYELNTTCLWKAIHSLMGFCLELPVIKSVQQLKETGLIIKEKLKALQDSCTEL